MNTLIFKTSVKYLGWAMIGFSIYLLMRGHQHPGGGFVGGLMAAAAFILFAMANGVDAARELLKVNPLFFVGLGLLCSLTSGEVSFLFGDPFMTGEWWFGSLFSHLELEAGTPQLFDIGVYLVVFGTTLTIILALLEE